MKVFLRLYKEDDEAVEIWGEDNYKNHKYLIAAFLKDMLDQDTLDHIAEVNNKDPRELVPFDLLPSED